MTEKASMGSDSVPMGKNVPPFSLSCGDRVLQRNLEVKLSSLGFDIVPDASILMLLGLQRGHAMHTLERGNKDPKNTKVIVVTWNPCPEHMEDLLDMKLEGVVYGHFFLRQDMTRAVDEVLIEVAAGSRFIYVPLPRSVLTRAERDVLRYAARGWSNKDIGEKLHLSEQTVKKRLSCVYEKIGIRNHSQAALYYWHMWQYPDKAGIATANDST